MSAVSSEYDRVASVGEILRKGRKLRRMGEAHGVHDLFAGGDGLLVGRLEEGRTHFDVASLAVEASQLLGAMVDVVIESALVGRRVPDSVWSGERL